MIQNLCKVSRLVRRRLQKTVCLVGRSSSSEVLKELGVDEEDL